MITDPIRTLIALHAQVIESGFNYAYFELARTRTTDWMAWLCTDAREVNPNRIVLATGQADTPDAACLEALESFIPKIQDALVEKKLTPQEGETLAELARTFHRDLYPSRQNTEVSAPATGCGGPLG